MCGRVGRITLAQALLSNLIHPAVPSTKSEQPAAALCSMIVDKRRSRVSAAHAHLRVWAQAESTSDSTPGPTETANGQLKPSPRPSGTISVAGTGRRTRRWSALGSRRDKTARSGDHSRGVFRGQGFASGTQSCVAANAAVDDWHEISVWRSAVRMQPISLHMTRRTVACVATQRLAYRSNCMHPYVHTHIHVCMPCPRFEIARASGAPSPSAGAAWHR